MPSVAIVTGPFVSGTTAMADALGASGYPFSIIDHPLANAGAEQLLAQARRTIADAALALADPRRPRAQRSV